MKSSSSRTAVSMAIRMIGRGFAFTRLKTSVFDVVFVGAAVVLVDGLATGVVALLLGAAAEGLGDSVAVLGLGVGDAELPVGVGVGVALGVEVGVVDEAVVP